MALVPCPYCGNQISSMATVCPVCGNQLAQPVSQTPPPASPYPAAPQNYEAAPGPSQYGEAPKRKGVPGWLIALIVFLSLAILGVVVALVLTNKKANYPDDDYVDISQSEVPEMSMAASEYNSASEAVDAVAPGPIGRDEWQEYKISSKNYGYVNVREATTTESAVVKVLYDGDYFYGNRLDYDPDWIEVFDEDGTHIGYVYYYCARHTDNHS